MIQSTTRHILILEDEDDFRDILVRSRHELDIRKDDELHDFGNSRKTMGFLNGLDWAVDIAVLDLVLNEKPSLAYARIKKPTEFEGIDIYEKYKNRFRQTIFLTSAANYRMAMVAGFDFKRPNMQICLKTNPVEAREEDRFPNNLIQAIKNAYAELDKEDAGQ
ncbi:MAG: hypothetical protein RKO66_09425 [Candidatus Contendobacter sp.]|nr:hypothetical protein [Candidatus Contendobacter sp.]MDS4059097.1 hypothetical protein [Candidatus Contendobacter sp.]